MIYIKIFFKNNDIDIFKYKNNYNISFSSCRYTNIYDINLKIISKYKSLTNMIINFQFNNYVFYNLICYDEKDFIYTFKKFLTINKNYFKYSIQCSAEFGDAKCRYNKNKQKLNIINIQNNRIYLNSSICSKYLNGTAVLEKNRIIYKLFIIDIENDNILILNKNCPFHSESVEINTICNKTYDDCKKYENIENFCGEPLAYFNLKYENTFLENIISVFDNIKDTKSKYYDNLHPAIKILIFQVLI